MGRSPWAATAPAVGQVYFGAGPAGVEVGVGGPTYGRYYDDDWRFRRRGWDRGYAYGGGACRVVCERIEATKGRLIIKTPPVCYSSAPLGLDVGGRRQLPVPRFLFP